MCYMTSSPTASLLRHERHFNYISAIENTKISYGRLL